MESRTTAFAKLPAAPETHSPFCHVTIQLTTRQPTQFIDITDRIQQVASDAGLPFAILNIQTLHTTTAILVNEHEPLLLTDFEDVLEAAAPVFRRYGERDGRRTPERSRPLPRAVAALVRMPERDARSAAVGDVAACVLRRARRSA
jgi:hypothetical protein